MNSRLGRGVVIDPTAHILGWRNVRIGNGSVICEYVVFNINNYTIGASTIEVGDKCWIGRRNFVSAGSSIQFDSYVMTGPDCHFMSANHVISDPIRPYISTGTESMGVMRIGANVWLGSRSSVLGGVSIGHGSVIGANALVIRDVPAFSIAVGSPARVIKRYHFGRKEWIAASDFDEAAEALLPGPDEYLDMLRAKNADITLPVRASGKSMSDIY